MWPFFLTDFDIDGFHALSAFFSVTSLFNVNDIIFGVEAEESFHPTFFGSETFVRIGEHAVSDSGTVALIVIFRFFRH